MAGYLSFAFFLLFCSSVLAAMGDNITPRHSHDIWDAAAGFPGGHVYSITQTADGYLWIGTSKGLFRYDGLTFVSIRANEASAGFPVLGLVTDSADQLWAADDHINLFRYTAGRLEGPLPDNGRHQSVAAPMNKTSDGSLLFVSTLQGLIEYKRGTAHVLLDPTNIPNWPTAVAQTADGTFWIGTLETGLFRLGVTRGAPDIQHVAGLGSAKINCLLPIGPSTLLIGTDKGLLTVHNGDLIQNANSELGNLEILALASGQKGDVWIGTDDHLFKVHAKDIHADGRIDSLDHLGAHGTVTALFEDREGNLWIGGPETIERYRDGGFTTYLSSDGLPSNNCGAIYVDRPGRVWFAPWDGGLFQLSHGRIQQIEVMGLKDDTVYSIAGGAGDEVWVARKYGGVTRFRLQGDALQDSTYTRPSGLAQDAVDSIYGAADGTVWAGTLDEGLSRFDGAKWRTFTSKDGLPSNRISVITGNAAGNIFVGTPDGLAVLKNDHWVGYTAHDGLPPGPVESLFLDDADTLWIGSTKGISYLQSGTVHVPLGAPNALYGEILGIAESNGWLWVTTRDRVVRVRCAALLKQSFGEGDYREFGMTEGLPSAEGVKRSRSVVKDNRGRIWFSLNQGISVLEPSAFAAPAFPVTTRLDGILVDGRPIPFASQIRIPPGRHRLTFRYGGVNVSNPDGVRYRYRLDNVDSEWSEPTRLREIDYTNIPPGRFGFHVMARNPDGIWSGNETTMTFEVEAAYWQTRWFLVSCVAALAVLLWIAYKVRVHSIQERSEQLALINAKLEAQIAERKQAEEALRQAQADLTRANRVSSMGELTASVAHEVNQPIAAAITDANTCLRWLSRDQPDLEEARAAASRIVQDGRRAGDIVNRVRLLFQKGTLQRELVNLNEIIREMILLLHSEATQSAVLVQTELAADLPEVMVDRVQLQQVFMNLMMNSIDAMKDVDGTRELTVQSQRGEDSQVLISVSDTGMGLPPQQSDKIFTAFFTTKTHGTGLGLRISRSIVESHGGRLWAADNSPRGARFCFTLPSSDETRT
jgi:signal transduction histidine kinase/ligand-binding sensor domain-containing protein